MTGKDLIIYILQNNLENVPIDFSNGFLGFLTVKQAAALYNVGEATVRIWHQLKAIEGIMIGDELYILPTSKPKIDM